MSDKAEQQYRARLAQPRACCTWCGHPQHPSGPCLEPIQVGQLIGNSLGRRVTANKVVATEPCLCARRP